MPQFLTMTLLAVAIAVVAAVLTGIATAWLSMLGGASLPNSLIRGGVAFGGTLTIELLTLGLLISH
ncbi:hypothetical protein [Rhizocola hellebori]|nr:hypothetical protein [Rhizocola hellebori]